MQTARTLKFLEFDLDVHDTLLEVTLHDFGIGFSLSFGSLSGTLTAQLHRHVVDTGSHMFE